MYHNRLTTEFIYYTPGTMQIFFDLILSYYYYSKADCKPVYFVFYSFIEPKISG